MNGLLCLVVLFLCIFRSIEDISSVSNDRFDRFIDLVKGNIGSRAHANWSQANHAQTFNASYFLANENIARIECSIAYAEFYARFLKKHRPVILKNCARDWLNEELTFDTLAEKYGRLKFYLKASDMKMSLRAYVRYSRRQQDDFPMYIFEAGTYPGRDQVKFLRDVGYRVPDHFQDDLKVYGDHKTPFTYVSTLIGAARTGTTTHIDPDASSAVTLTLSGRKFWVLFPPHMPPHLYHREGVSEGLEWIEQVYRPLIRLGKWPRKYLPIEAVQRPGETIYVPQGWAHAVLNLDEVVALSTNFHLPSDFPKTWFHMVRENTDFAFDWLKSIKRAEFFRMSQSVDKLTQYNRTGHIDIEKEWTNFSRTPEARKLDEIISAENICAG